MVEVVQYFTGVIPEAYKKCMDQLRSKIPSDYAYNLITEGTVFDRKESCLLRLELLKENQNRMWIDCDVMVNEWPNIEDSKPYVYAGNCAATIMYLPGFDIQGLIDNFKRQQRFRRCCHYLFERYNPELRRIPVECFHHLRLGTK
jgi:hypothetical protein